MAAGYPGGVRRFVFQPRWVLGHLLVLAAALSCLLLADWQWTRAYQTEALQNWGYALQWPLFSVFFLIGWWRMLRLEARRLEDERRGASTSATEPALDAPVLAPPTAPDRRAEGPEQDADGPDVDERLAAYNRMLAALAERTAEHDDRARRR